MIYYYCILPSGNRSEFGNLDAELKKRGVAADYADLHAGGRLYRIPQTELPKLPKDEKGPYLGDDDSGHTIYPLVDEAIACLDPIGEFIPCC